MKTEPCKSGHAHHPQGKVAFLDDPKRRGDLSPENLISLVAVKETDSILDFGAGTGYFTLPLARKVEGSVYALDTDSSMLELIKSKALQENIFNIVPVLGGTAKLPLPDETIDIVLASLVLHEINPLAKTLSQIKDVLKENGILVCVEFEATGNSSHKAPRISSAEMEQSLMDAGFRISKKIFPTESLYVLIAIKVKNVQL